MKEELWFQLNQKKCYPRSYKTKTLSNTKKNILNYWFIHNKAVKQITDAIKSIISKNSNNLGV